MWYVIEVSEEVWQEYAPDSDEGDYVLEWALMISNEPDNDRGYVFCGTLDECKQYVKDHV